ncbi:MAG: ATP synthase subunit C [Oscillospiraceae bacterium]
MKSTKKTARIIFCMALMVALFAAFSMTGFAAEAEPAAEAAAATNNSNSFAYIAMALSTGLAAIGAGVAVGSGAPAAIGALTEDPKSFGKALIFVALGEGIALYGMLISILIFTKI